MESLGQEAVEHGEVGSRNGAGSPWVITFPPAATASTPGPGSPWSEAKETSSQCLQGQQHPEGANYRSGGGPTKHPATHTLKLCFVLRVSLAFH